MNIAVYSGSFNPLHIGHLAIMKHTTERLGFTGRKEGIAAEAVVLIAKVEK